MAKKKKKKLYVILDGEIIASALSHTIKVKIPEFPLDRITCDGAWFTFGICPNCHSTVFKEHVVWGKKHCCNDKCPYSKKPIK